MYQPTANPFLSAVSPFSGYGLDPAFATTLAQLLTDCRNKGYDFRISQGLRTPQKQAEYYCQWDQRSPSKIDKKAKEMKDSGAPWLASVLLSYRNVARTPRWLTSALPGAGWHQWGLAADCYCYRNGSMVTDGSDPCYKYYAERATTLGLTAGYYFTKQDSGHVQGPKQKDATLVHTWPFIDQAMKDRFGDKENVATSSTPAPPPAFAMASAPIASPAASSQFLKDDPTLTTAPLKPASAYVLPSSDAALRGMARTYNAVGGLVDRLAQRLDIDTVAMLAVWYVESGGKEFVVNEPVLRFENHKFYKYWGKDHEQLFDQHFQFGGHAGIAGASSKKHKFRRLVSDAWQSVHVDDQNREYQAFAVAETLGGREAACLSSSFGGPQIMGFNHEVCGYANASALADAFRADERWHVLGFADFCRANNLLGKIRDQRWEAFGDSYNGDGGVYGPKIETAFGKKAALLALPKVPNP